MDMSVLTCLTDLARKDICVLCYHQIAVKYIKKIPRSILNNNDG